MTAARIVGRGKLARQARGLPGWFLVVVGLVGLVLSGCGGPFGLGRAAAPQLSAQEIVQRADTALGKIDSFHFDLSTDTGGKPGAAAFNLLAAKGDAAKPDKLSAELQVMVAGFSASVKYISAGGRHYMTDPISQRWMEVPPQLDTVALFSPDQGLTGLLRGLTDLQRGADEKIDGVDSYRLSGKAGGAALQPVLGAAAPAPLDVTIWVGTKDFLIRRLVIVGGILQGEPNDTKRTLTIGQFNAPVEITAPTT